MTYNDVVRMRRFGVVTRAVCEFDLNNLIDPQNLPDTANYFFELYILDSQGQLQDVPVRISNYRDESGDQPNLDFDHLDFETNKLFRRFFIFDTVSGISDTGGYLDEKKPKVVNFAKNIKLTVALDPLKAEAI